MPCRGGSGRREGKRFSLAFYLWLSHGRPGGDIPGKAEQAAEGTAAGKISL